MSAIYLHNGGNQRRINLVVWRKSNLILFIRFGEKKLIKMLNAFSLKTATGILADFHSFWSVTMPTLGKLSTKTTHTWKLIKKNY